MVTSQQILALADKLAKNKRMLEITRARQTLALTRAPFAVSTLSHDGVEPLWRAVVNLATKT